MGDCLPIARIYLRGTTAVLWCFMLFCLLLVSADAGAHALNQGGFLVGVLSRKSYLAMFGYFNACLLGVLLRDSLARPWASLVPHYRQKHLLVTTLIAVLLLGVPMLLMQFVGTSDVAPSSVAVIFLTCLAAGLWTLHYPVLGFLVIPFLVFVFAPSSSFPGLPAFLAGTTPAASMTLAFVSLFALGALGRRLLALKEETLEYTSARVWGDLLNGWNQIFLGQGKAFDDYTAALPADQRATFQNFDWQNQWLTNLRQVEELSGYRERGLWQRLKLWRLGTAPTRTFVAVAQLVLLSFICIPPFVWLGLSARDVVVIFAVQVMTNPFNLWLYWITRRHRLGYESLRPRTRSEFVRELGLALAWDIIQCWISGNLFMAIAAAIWVPELLQASNLLLFVFCTGAGQLCGYAMMSICLLRRGMAPSFLCAFCSFMAMMFWMNFIVMNGSLGLEVNLTTACILAAASAATVALAYRRWCQADLE